MAGYIIKVTRECNLRCTYCHEWEAFGVHPPLSFRTLVELTKKALLADSRVQFIWHGGEPLTRGRAFYEKAVAVQDLLRQDHHVITNSLQTNGLLLSEHWCQFFKTYRFHVGVSIDGPAELHDAARKRTTGGGSYQRVRKGINLLRQFGVDFGVLFVLTASAARLGASRIFDWAHDLGVHGISFLPVLPDNPSQFAPAAIRPEYLTRAAYSQFMANFYDISRAHPDHAIHVRELDGIRAALHGELASVCTLAGSCAGQYFGVEANGDMYHCDKYRRVPEFRLGNIHVDDIAALRMKPHTRQIAAANRVAEERARAACRWYNVCRGGCPHDRYIWRHQGGEEPCCGQARLIEHIAHTENPLRY
jgi:uncharacterized protein